jgi:exopolysaccharide production protein ExoZ
MLPSTTSRLTSIQVLRGVAASVVVLHHFAQATATYATRPSRIVASGVGELGAAGVDLFFVISGFIMVYTTTRRAGTRDAVDFIDKRLRRVLPPYWVWTSVLLLLWLSGLALRSHHYSPAYLVSSYLLIPFYNGSSHHPLLDQGWTLSFEMLFYAAFALAIATVGRRARILVVVLALALAALLGTLLPATNAVRDLLCDTLMFEFVFGMIVAELALATRARVVPKYLPALLITVGTLALLATTRLDHTAYARGLVWGLPSALIVLGAALRQDARERRWLTFVGDASYSIYLTHAFATLAYGTLFQKLPILQAAQPDLLIVVATLGAIVSTSCAYPLVEKPLTALLSRRSSKRVERPVPEPVLDSPAEG